MQKQVDLLLLVPTHLPLALKKVSKKAKKLLRSLITQALMSLPLVLVHPNKKNGYTNTNLNYPTSKSI
jgi:hypothetical protein